MAGIWDGTLTAAEFEAAALHLVEVWKSQCPQLPAWTWHVYEPPLKSPVLASSLCICAGSWVFGAPGCAYIV